MAENDGRPSPIDLLIDHSIRDSFECFKEQMSSAMLFPDKRGIRKYCLNRAVSGAGTDALFAEFGVWKGVGVNLFAKLLGADVPIWGFDSFEGLEEDWTGHAKGGQAGRFSLQGALPEVAPNVTLVKGWVQDTVPGWLADHSGRITFAHMDMDTYTPTRFVLEAILSRLEKGSVLLFDELYGYPGWRHHEWKAVQECLPADSYRFIAFSQQAVGIEMIKPPV